MMNQRSLAERPKVSGQVPYAPQRRTIRMASLAALFSLFALYLASHAAMEDETALDELPLAAARAQGPGLDATQVASRAGAKSNQAEVNSAEPNRAAANPANPANPATAALSSAAGTVRAQGASHAESALNASPADSPAAQTSGAVPGASSPSGGGMSESDADSADLVKRGAYLARAGDCMACHTADPGRPFAGGVPIGTPFGTLYTPNITPDPETGIGRWTDAEFIRAMHEGVGKGGQHLYPAFPYTEYTRVTERDVLAIRAYLGTVAPIHYTPPRNALRFPFNQRWLLFLWKLFNFREGRFVPDPKQSPLWNRGAYLVEGLAHCEECHTPRNIMQGLKSADRFSGEVQAGWHAFNITPDRAGGIGKWSDDDLARYLAVGVAPGRANAAGPMAEVVENSTQFLTPEDLRAIGTYLRALPPVAGGAKHARDEWGKPVDDVTSLRGTPVTGVNGAQLFVANCASCHDWTGNPQAPLSAADCCVRGSHDERPRKARRTFVPIAGL